MKLPSSLSIRNPEMDGRRRRSSEDSSGWRGDNHRRGEKNIYVFEQAGIFSERSKQIEVNDQDDGQIEGNNSVELEKENVKNSPRLKWKSDEQLVSELNDGKTRRGLALPSEESSDYELAVLEDRIQAWKGMYPLGETRRRMSVPSSVKLLRGKMEVVIDILFVSKALLLLTYFCFQSFIINKVLCFES